ncbi:MAG TPA: GAF domain-containing protein [Ktedonobacteraceae bacterium]|nr:GAF domain-containing protein [Ktedonobacteraceae bacterium]
MIVKEHRFRQRIIDELGIKPITITRWIEGRSEPRQQNFRQLINALPEFRENFYELLGEEFTEAAIVSASDASKAIPSEFFARVMSERTSTQRTIRFWSLCYLILQQAIGQLDPDQFGMAITVVQCMKSSSSPVIRSLRETAAYGTVPWQSNMEQKGMFLGAESLAGYCVSSCRGVENNDVRDRSNPLPAHQVPDELSAAAYPILLSGKVAGCLLVSSTQPNFFLSQFRLNLIHNYANLISLLFEPEQFFDLDKIRLQIMPLHIQQKAYFSDFRHRVINAMRIHQLSNMDAEQLVWEELEKNFLAFEQ